MQVSLHARFRVASGLLWEADAEERRCYIYSRRQKDFFSLEGVGYLVWAGVLSRLTVGQILKKVAARRPMNGSVDPGQDVFELLSDLERRGFIGEMRVP